MMMFLIVYLNIIISHSILMFSNFLKNGLSSLESMSIIPSMQNNPNNKNQQIVVPPPSVEKIVEHTLELLFVTLSQRIGEEISKEEMKELSC